ncbi:adenosylcobinamide-phosphate guanylyltransferase [beta proteobacterium AAP121]|nr:adenosylcobinamide-phosphate guanylyltransferase [beta proteobacterium AAP65]KPF96781.1 adenosylcobinamide-phosphate guanylyltransferase [beta proteobacterium AAP121]
MNTAAAATVAHELLLGGARSGKSRAAEARAAAWLGGPVCRGGLPREALLLATAVAGDEEMAERIRRHQADRALRLPALGCVEVAGLDLAEVLARHSTPQRLLVVDCLTLWLTQLALPLQGPPATADALHDAGRTLVQALRAAPGPVVLVSNEIGLGVMPLGAETRRFVDALGGLHQALAAACARVTLLVAGCELPVKEMA